MKQFRIEYEVYKDFLSSTIKSLKKLFFSVTLNNNYASVPICHSVNRREKYENVEVFLQRSNKKKNHD